jgi:chemotaxis protein MotA
MDITTFAGILAGAGILFLAIFQGGGVGIFINIPSLMITAGGTLAATLINYPLGDIFRVMKVTKSAFLHKMESPEKTIKTLVAFAEKARREGLLALEKDLHNVDDDFLKGGLELAIDGIDPDLVASMLRMELTFLMERHRRGQGMFKAMGKFAPAFGMLGTLIGLIQMLRSIEDPSSIGPGMAVALITTFYGTLIANLICIPLAGKLENISEHEVMVKEIVIEGIRSIQSGDSPRVVERKLKSFLAPKMRQTLAAQKAGAK